MKIDHFLYLFKRVSGFYLLPHYILFRKPLELWNDETGESIYFKKIPEMLSHIVEGETIADIIARTEQLNIPLLTGGRGASSGAGGTFKFNHAQDNGSGLKAELPPAAANVRIKTKTPEAALEHFRKIHGNSDHEWGYEVDDQGFVHQYVEGGRSSVAIFSRSKNTMIYHNHPSGGAFSDSDLISVSMQKRAKGIVASGTKYNYIFQKGTHFKANNFIKAVKTAKMKGSSYDDAVHKWLTKNQKKYGYKYSREK